MKQIIMWGALLGGAAIISGCSSTAGNVADSASPSAEITTDEMKNTRPQREPDLMGTVKEVVGNEFTVEAIDKSSSPLLNMTQQELMIKMQELPDEKKQAFFQEMQQARETAKTYSVNVLIPAGIPISVRKGFGGGANFPGGGGFGGNRGAGGGATRPGGQGQGLAGALGANRGNNQRQGMGTGTLGTIEDIKLGSMLSVWLMTGTEDRKIAERATVQQVQAQGAQGFGGPGGQGGGQGGFGGGGQGGSAR